MSSCTHKKFHLGADLSGALLEPPCSCDTCLDSLVSDGICHCCVVGVSMLQYASPLPCNQLPASPHPPHTYSSAQSLVLTPVVSQSSLDNLYSHRTAELPHSFSPGLESVAYTCFKSRFPSSLRNDFSCIIVWYRFLLVVSLFLFLVSCFTSFFRFLGRRVSF